MEYSSQVRRRFEAPGRAGEVSRNAGTVLEGTAEDKSLGVWVRYQIRLQGEVIGQVRFRAFGCPHLIAAADRLAEDLEGQPAAALIGQDINALADSLEVPRTKLGKLLRLEDALLGCHRQLEQNNQEG